MEGIVPAAPPGWSQHIQDQWLLFTEIPFCAAVTQLKVWHLPPLLQPSNSVTPSFKAFIFTISPCNNKNPQARKAVLLHQLNQRVRAAKHHARCQTRLCLRFWLLFSSRSFLSLYLVTLWESLIQILTQLPPAPGPTWSYLNSLCPLHYLARSLTRPSPCREGSLRAAAHSLGFQSLPHPISHTDGVERNPCFWLPGYLQIQAGMFTLLPNF